MSLPTILTPVASQVYNEFDKQGVLLNLPRLYEEKNSEYKQRLYDVMVNRANSTYQGMINGITRELGLQISDAMTISYTKDSNGFYLAANPAVIFDGNLCRLITDLDPTDVDNSSIYLDIDRHDPSQPEWYLDGLINAINATPYFVATLASGANPWVRSETIWNQSTVILIQAESISVSSTRIKLAHEDLVEGSVVITSRNLTQRVMSDTDLVKGYEYYIDLDAGMLYTLTTPEAGSWIRYMYRDDPVTLQASPVILHDIRRAPFRYKLFEQVIDGLNNARSASPTLEGLDIFNEIMTVIPTTWGP